MGACLGPTAIASSKEGEETELSKPEDALVSWVAVTGEVDIAVRQDELEPVRAGADRNVEVNATTIAGPDLTICNNH